MKKIILIAMTVIVSSVFSSCDPLNMLKGYEELLSLSASEEEECLTAHKWVFNKIGYALTQNIYDVEHIDTEGYPAVSSSIESIEFGKDGSFTVNLKENTKFIERYSEQGIIKERECWHKTYTATNDGPRLRFGIGDSDVEEFVILSFVTGGTNYQCSMYGREKRDGYQINRMILVAGIGGIHPQTYYEFLPQK